MGSRAQVWDSKCPWCPRMIDPLGIDNPDEGYSCGVCLVDFAQARALARLREWASTPVLPPRDFVLLAQCLGGSRSGFRRAMNLYVMKLFLVGKLYGFRPCTLVLFDAVRTDTSDVLDIVLDYAIGMQGA